MKIIAALLAALFALAPLASDAAFTSKQRGKARVPLAFSAASGNSHTGNTTQTALATVTVPPLGANGGLVVTFVPEYTNDASTKTWRVVWGGTTWFQVAPSTTQSAKVQVQIWNRGATNSQVGGPAGIFGFSNVAAAAVTAAVDTTVATTLTITVELADGTDTGTLQAYEVSAVLD